MTHPWIFVRDVFWEVRAFIQRGLRGYADCDCWAIDCYLNSIVPKMLKQLRGNTHGCPNKLVIDVHGKDIQSVHEGVEDWNGILVVIEEAFRLKQFLFNDYYFTEDAHWKKVQDKMTLHEFLKTDNDFIEYGLLLFVEFYDSLWD